MVKLTDQQIKDKVFKNTLETCEYLSGYQNCYSKIKLKCIKHEYVFQTQWDNIRRNTRAHHVCPLCIQQDKNNRYKENRVELKCDYCSKIFIRPKSKLKNSKSGLYFCCREHKDLAQSMKSGEDFNIIRPQHYGKVSSNYRKCAFSIYEHKCAVCGWQEDQQILQVHHIDGNRENNDKKNLIILCPNCHAKITFGKYKLVDREKIIKI